MMLRRPSALSAADARGAQLGGLALQLMLTIFDAWRGVTLGTANALDDDWREAQPQQRLGFGVCPLCQNLAQ